MVARIVGMYLGPGLFGPGLGNVLIGSVGTIFIVKVAILNIMV